MEPAWTLFGLAWFALSAYHEAVTQVEWRRENPGVRYRAFRSRPGSRRGARAAKIRDGLFVVLLTIFLGFLAVGIGQAQGR